jgi:NAD(P)-dependent dehydrogenase (short-subunit alcohol dehydrogenase family)
MQLRDKIALITGANRGIGRAIAERFHAEGAHVMVTGRQLTRCAPVAQSLGDRAYAYALDVTDDASVASAVSAIYDDHGRIDIVVNCAGIIQYHTPVWQTSIEDWDQMMRVNLRGTFLVCHAVAPHMQAAGSGVIINIASSSARMADDDLGAYTASKWGVAGYTTSLAKSLRPHGVRVNGLNPGWVDTDMSRAFDASGNQDWSTAAEIAESALFLAARAPRDMTGQFLDIFGS